MTYTGHKNTKMPDGKTLVEWITPTVLEECRHYGVETPTYKQMAAIISALRMHTIIVHASQYDFSDTGKPDTPTEFYPIQSSIGRYFRDAVRETLEDKSIEGEDHE